MKNRLLLSVMTAFVTLQPLAVSAQQLVDSRGFAIDPAFDPNLVLSDADVYEPNNMSYPRLVAFLDSKGALNRQSLTDIDGISKTAAEIIWRAAQAYKISPKFLLAMLQKEQSLVEDLAPTQRQLDWAMGFGVCDDCSKDDPSIQDFKGFANQVEYTARQMREKYYMRILTLGHTGNPNYAPGKTIVIDGITVTPVNAATASLYAYTPHIHGNQNMWRIWKRWFTRNFPDGTVMRGTPSGTLYWIRNGLKRPFASPAVAASVIDPSKIIDVADTELTTYEDGTPIAFPNYALLKDSSGKIWLLVNDVRRHIQDMDAFRKFSFNMDEVEEVTDADLIPYEIGEPITVDTQYPQGALLQDSVMGETWYVEDGVRRLVDHPALLSLYFKNRKPKKVDPTVLMDFTKGQPYQLHDGELVKTDVSPVVYVMEHGQRRPIMTEETFNELGWKWKNIIALPEMFLTSYPVGPNVQVDNPATQLATN